MIDMLMLLGLALPMAILGFSLDDSDDDENTVELEGGDDADRLEGEEGSDFIDGHGGDDILNGRAGDDTVFGREGDDVLQGEDGNDMLCSGDGDDIVTGNTGQDFIEGQGGDDFVSGDYGWDVVRGDEGNDTVLGGRGSDTVEGGDGDDIVFGGILEGIPLNLEELTDLRDGGSLEEINGGIEMRDDSIGNILRGGDGDDDLIIGSGDTAAGGTGADTFHLMSEQVNASEATIVGYDSDDAITVIVDDASEDADITVSDDGEDAVISMGDTILARVEGAAGTLGSDDVVLISESVIEQMFDPNAAAA
jgi:Ca2+-binding RTX toxin-like protein